MSFQIEKQLVREFYAKLESAPVDEVPSVLGAFCAPDLTWRGYHPFNELRSPESVATSFWQPLRRSFSGLTRRMDIYFAGRNQIDGFASTWVVSMGHLVGLLDRPWLGIEPTGRMAFLRYCEFSRVEDSRITDTAMFFDIPHLMMQCGLKPFPPQAGAHLVQPGPATHDGLLFRDRPPEEGEATLAAINAMISDLGTWQSGLPLEEELARTWHSDMIWWGPAGIGATYTIGRYARQHSGPFRAAFTGRSSTGHICRLAEGSFGGFFGWPNFTAVLAKEYLGLAPSDQRLEFRVIDIYRQSGGKLAENWVFIDLPHVFSQRGIGIIPDCTV